MCPSSYVTQTVFPTVVNSVLLPRPNLYSLHHAITKKFSDIIYGGSVCKLHLQPSVIDLSIYIYIMYSLVLHRTV